MRTNSYIDKLCSTQEPKIMSDFADFTQGHSPPNVFKIMPFGNRVSGILNRVKSKCYNRELKHERFLDADGNRKRTFRVLGPYYLPDFYTTYL